jgi:Mg2+ and Co2+ transporter CorA
MKILTLVSCILLPLIFIASLYGMKINVPIENQAASFLIIAGVMTGIALFVLIFFRIRKWM